MEKVNELDVIIDCFKELFSYNLKNQVVNDFNHGKVVNLNGYEFKRDIWCIFVWKPTDISKEPEYKGEPLLKIVPRTIRTYEGIRDVLKLQGWSYI